MRRFRAWIYGKFLPAWCKDDLLKTNARLTEAILDLKQENERLNAYISGIHDAMRAQRRMIIHTGGEHQ
ncbi:MAG: hypothetical protein H6Q60_1167 [Oscillospiraceae bacterium]|nr:hypothetical protein [Oscillospiraceae bacterium]